MAREARTRETLLLPTFLLIAMAMRVGEDYTRLGIG